MAETLGEFRYPKTSCDQLTERYRMKITLGKTIGSVLLLGIVAGGGFFILRHPPRPGAGRGSVHSQRPDSQTDELRSVGVDSRTVDESEIASAKLISAAKPTETAIAESSLNWSRFRGPNGSGVSSDTLIATEWSDTKNLRWKTKLPGRGSSSPVLTDKHAFLTTLVSD